MKLHNKIFASMAVAVISLSSCDKNFDKINTDSNRPLEVPTYGILTNAQIDIAAKFNNEWSGQRITGLPSQQWSQYPYTKEDRYNYKDRASSVAIFFEDTYALTELLKQISYLNDGTQHPTLASPYGDAAIQSGSATILKAYLIIQCAEVYGDVPYTEANLIKDGTIKPKYDKQQAIFEGLIAELTSVNNSLKAIETTGKGWTQGDIMFKGDISKWRKFGNSLRLRMAIRMSKVNNDKAMEEADKAINDGVMESNSDNAIIQFTGGGVPNNAPLYQSYLNRNDFTLSWQFTNLMKGNDDVAIGFTNPFNGLSDPRLTIFAYSPDMIKSGALSNQNVGLPYGIKDDNVVSVVDQLKKDKVFLNYIKTGGIPDNKLPLPLQATFRVALMDYTNTVLFMAEHKNLDADLYMKGVNASLAMWGVAASEANAYAAAAKTKFDAATDDVKLEMIITQKYIHNFAHTMAEPWTEYRRTGYPKSLVLPGQQTGPIIAGKTNYFNTADAAHGDRVIDRMQYPNVEGTTNKENLTNAIISIGGDAQNIPLWWSKAYKK